LTAVGLNVTEIVQIWCGCIEEPQLFV